MPAECELPPTDSTLAVHGKDIYFYFDRKKKTPILNDFNIAVARGVIYSLLGPSGCGKTTLLKCIVGQHKLQEGSLHVYGKVPGSRGSSVPGQAVGYMPQDLALYLDMTTEETLSFFGSLYRMNRQQIKERISFLADLLSLPDTEKQIKKLSGGQKRRVSFAASLIHKPPLLILDEPTVGVDPILRKAIWTHLIALAKNELMTIIVTTHYIEEARQAHYVGLMRDGQLLAERKPDELIRQYGAITLEEVFLQLCESNENEEGDHETCFSDLISVECAGSNYSALNSKVWVEGKNNGVHANAAESNHPFHVKQNGDEAYCERIDEHDKSNPLLSSSPFPKKIDFAPGVISSITDSWMRFFCLTKKNFLCLRRNLFFLIFQIFVPAGLVMLYFLCIGTDLFDLTIAIANMEETPEGFGIKFLRTIDNLTFIQKQFPDLSSALDSVKRGESWAAMHINSEFSACLLDRFEEGTNASNDTIACSDIDLYLDMSNSQISLTVHNSVFTSFKRFAADMLQQHGKNPRIADLPINVKDPVYGSRETTFTQFLGPGMILGITYIMAAGLSEMAIILEKKRGLLERSFVSGATAAEVFLSHFCCLLFVMVIQVILVLLCVFFVFHNPCEGPIVWVVISSLLVGVSGMSSGLLISSITEDENIAVMLVVGSFYTNIFLGGAVWPLEGMPHFLRYLSYCLPLTLIIKSTRNILARGWNITDQYTWDGCVINIFWIIAFVALSIMLFKIRK